MESPAACRTFVAVRASLVAVLAALLAGCVASAPAQQTAVAARPLDLLYVCVQDEAKIAVIDVGARELVRMIDLTALGFSPNAKPHHVAVEPDGSHWYVSLIGDGKVVRFDRDDRVVGRYETETPGMLAFDAERGLLLASRSMSAVNPPSRISLIEVASMEGEDVEVFFPRPHPMVVSADGRWAYTGSLGENQLGSVDLETDETTLTTIDGPPHALVQFALSPDQRTLIAATEVSGRLLVFDRMDPANPKLTASVEIGATAFDPVFAPDGRTVWVPVKGANQVAIIDSRTWTVTRRIESASLLQPHAVLFSPDGRWAFVSNNSKADHMADPEHGGHAGAAAGGDGSGVVKGNVTVIDATSFEVSKFIELGANVTGMGMRAVARAR